MVVFVSLIANTRTNAELKAELLLNTRCARQTSRSRKHSSNGSDVAKQAPCEWNFALLPPNPSFIGYVCGASLVRYAQPLVNLNEYANGDNLCV
jgi:hypothetical protein